MPQRSLVIRPGGDQIIPAPPTVDPPDPPPPPPPPPPPTGSFRTYYGGSQLEQQYWGVSANGLIDTVVTELTAADVVGSGGLIDDLRAASNTQMILKVTPGNNSTNSDGSYKLRNADGTFSPAKHKAIVLNFFNAVKAISGGFTKFRGAVADGTIRAIYLLDDFAGTLGGNAFARAVTYSELEDISQNVKVTCGASFLPCVVRGKNTYLKGTATLNGTVRQYRYLDAGWNQYRFDNQGDLDTYVSSQLIAGRAAGLGAIAALNTLDGGAGTDAAWRQHPDSGTLFGVSPAEIRLCVQKFMQYTHVTGQTYAMFNCWTSQPTLDPDGYMQNASIKAALLAARTNWVTGRVDGPLNIRGDLVAA